MPLPQSLTKRTASGPNVGAPDLREVTCKVLVVGPHKVGKTTLVNYVAKDKFQAVGMTIGVDFATKAWVCNTFPDGPARIIAEFTDIMGQDGYPHVQRYVSRNTKTVLVVGMFPLVPEELEVLGTWVKAAQDALIDSVVPIQYLVVLNKVDQVTSEQAKQQEKLAREYFLVEKGATKDTRPFDPTPITGITVTSARTGQNVKSLLTFVENYTKTLPSAEFAPNPVALPTYTFSAQKKQKKKSSCANC